MNFDAVKAELGGYIHRAVLRQIPDTDQADVEAMIWISIWTALHNFRGEASVKTFVYPIMRRRIADYYREAYKHKKVIAAAKAELIEPSVEAFEENAGTILPTPAELRILKEMADGRTNEKIAKDLFLSIDTVRSHIKSLYKKLGMKNRGEICVFAHKFFKER